MHEPTRCSERGHTSSRQADICVAVCTRNRAEQLRSALASLVGQTAGKGVSIEYLIINNGSSDHTGQVIQEFMTQHPELAIRKVDEPEVGFAQVRHRASRETDAEWIAYFDDDQIADPHWLGQLWEVARRRNANCVGGAVLLEFKDSPFRPGDYCRRLLGETGPHPERRYGEGFEPGMGNVLLRRTLVQHLGEVDRHRRGRGEDTRLFRRLIHAGEVAWFAPQATVHHVISAERNVPAAYRALAKACSEAGDLSWSRWRWALPAVAILRLTVAVGVNVPQVAWRSLFGTRADRLDQECLTIFNLWRGYHELRFCGRALRGRLSAHGTTRS